MSDQRQSRRTAPSVPPNAHLRAGRGDPCLGDGLHRRLGALDRHAGDPRRSRRQLADAQWVSNAYLLFLSSLLLIGGAAGDRFGLRNVFSLGIVLFVVASLVCAVAPTPLFLIVARAVQGLGAALMVPGSLAIIAKAYPREERGRAIGIWSAASSLTTILGPVIGGFVLTTLGDWSWRLVFAINLPLGGIALALLWLRVPRPTRRAGRRLDMVGGALVTVGLLLDRLGPDRRRQHAGAAASATSCSTAASASRCLPAFLVWEARASAPMLPLRLFRSRQLLGRQGADLRALFRACGRDRSSCR